KQKYVANPAKRPRHGLGLAIDVGLMNAQGNLLDMGTPFDHFGPLAHTDKEEELVAQGKLSREQVKNRQALRSLMQSAGFTQLSHEWWHYDVLPKAVSPVKYQ